jgi:hypothetical protein
MSDNKITLVSLFKKASEELKKELTDLYLPKDIGKIIGIFSTFFVEHTFVKEYGNNLTPAESRLFDAALKLLQGQTEMMRNFSFIENLQSRRGEKQSRPSRQKEDLPDAIKAAMPPSIGGVVGGLLFGTWGAVLLSAACTALANMYLGNDRQWLSDKPDNIQIDVDRYLEMFQNICNDMDDIMDVYRTNLSIVKKHYESIEAPSLETTYLSVLDRIRKLHAAVHKHNTPPEVIGEYERLLKTLSNYYCEMVDYTEETKQYFECMKNPNGDTLAVEQLLPAIVSNERIVLKGEVLLPQKEFIYNIIS